MELSTIEMEKNEAKEAFQQYRAAVKERHNAEDEQIMRVYRELARGRQVIRLSEAVQNGGTTSLWGRDWQKRKVRYDVPMIAVARANREFVWTPGIAPDGGFSMSSKRYPHHNNTFDWIRMAAGTFPADEERSQFGSWSPSIRAIIPTIPPPLRPVAHLRNYHILWEAKWGIDPPPPGDPALLKQISGDLFAVLAIWDLTEVEQAVLAGRTPSE